MATAARVIVFAIVRSNGGSHHGSSIQRCTQWYVVQLIIHPYRVSKLTDLAQYRSTRHSRFSAHPRVIHPPPHSPCQLSLFKGLASFATPLFYHPDTRRAGEPIVRAAADNSSPHQLPILRAIIGAMSAPPVTTPRNAPSWRRGQLKPNTVLHPHSSANLGLIVTDA